VSASLDTGGARAHRPRYALIDIVRGIAIIAMIVYHAAWDLWFLQFIQVPIAFDPGWIAFQRTILSTFLFLVGTGLVLGHGAGIKWRSFRRRFGLIAGGALLVTIGTYFAFPESFVYFGILHAIALFSLFGLAFLRLPIWLNAALGLVLLILPTLFTSTVFDAKALSWIGLWQTAPYTEDLVPVVPWFGVVLFGIAGTRLAQRTGIMDRIARVAPGDPLSRALAWMGRWSLVIYLVHQPVLLGILMPLAMWLEPEIEARNAQFYGSCVASCEDSAGGQAAYCTTYCQCSLDRIEADQLWPLLDPGSVRTEDDNDALVDLTNQCAAQALTGMPALEAPVE